MIDNLGLDSLSDDRWIDHACDRFEIAWRGGQPLSIESVLAAYPDRLRERILVELIAIEIYWRRKNGEKPIVGEYSSRFMSLDFRGLSELIESVTADGGVEVDVLTLDSPNVSIASRGDEDHWHSIRFIGDYELLEPIARGGMGVVYKAMQKKLGRVVAIKMIRNGQFAEADEIERFRAEASAVAKLDHPGIVPIYEIGEQLGFHFYSMAFIDGRSLADRITEGPLPPRESAYLVGKMADALHHAHQKGIIHRDLKPANILLDEHGQPRVTDFGLAKQLQSSSDLTRSGQILGTPSYMPPEQAAARSSTIGPASDVYSLGAILYCLLTGRPPFQSADVLETLRQVCETDPIPPSRLVQSTPRDLETIALHCLEKRPEQRFSTAGELSSELQRFLDGRPILTRPVGTLERVLRWSRRQPLVAALLAAVTTTVVVGTLMITYLLIQERQGRRRLEQSLYRSQVMQADLEWQAGNVGRADTLLDACDLSQRNWEWRFLKRRCHAERLELRSPDARVRQITYSPHGDQLFSAGINAKDGVVRRWNAHTGKELTPFWQCDSPVMSIACSANSKLVAAGLQNGRVIVWDAHSGQQKFTRLLHGEAVNCLIFHPNSEFLASGSDDGFVKLLNTTSREVPWVHDARVPLRSLAFDLMGTTLAAAGVAQEILIFDAGSGHLQHSLSTGQTSTRAIAFTVDSRRLLSADADHNSVRIWDLATEETTGSIAEHTTPIRTFTISSDGSTIASGGYDGMLMIWNAETGEQVRTWKAHNLSLDSLAFRPDNNEIASCGIDNSMRIWNLDSPDAVPQSSGHMKRVNEVAFSPNGSLVASASKDGTVRLWDAETAKAGAVCHGHNGMVLAVAFSRQDDWIVSAGEDGQVLRYNARTGKLVDKLASRDKPIWSVDVHTQGKLIAFGGDDGNIYLQNIDNLTVEKTKHADKTYRSGHEGGVKCVRFSPDGRLLASCGEDAKIKLWRVGSSELLRTLELHIGTVWHVAFSRDGRMLASSGKDGAVVVWDLVTGKPEQTFIGHVGDVYGTSFSADDSRLASAGFDQTVKIWERSTGQDLLTLREPEWSVNSVAFSPDGETIAAGSSDSRVRLWHSRRLP